MDEVSRRELLRLCAAAAASFVSGGVMSEAQNLVPAVKAVDHLLLGVSDLDAGIDWVEKRTGVRAAMGGSHPGMGTRNALLSLGGRQYLEIYAPDPAQTTFNARIDLRKLGEPRLIGWAAVARDIEGLATKVREKDQKVDGPRDGARARPDGSTLRWKTLAIPSGLPEEIADPIPFFIEWAAQSVHPSQDSPEGCELQSLAFEAPDPAAVAGILKVIGIEGHVARARAAAIRATLITPRGTLALS